MSLCQRLAVTGAVGLAWASLAVADAPLATFHGRPLTASFFRKAVASQGELQDDLATDPSFRRQFLDRIIAIKLMAIEAETLGIDKDPDVQERLAVAREQLLAEAYLARRAATERTEAAIQAFFERNRPFFAREAHVAHALFSTVAAAQAFHARASQPGADFLELIKPLAALAPSPAAGGDLGFVRRGAMPTAFDDVVFATPAGQLYDSIVRTPLGFHVVKVLAFRSSEVTLDAVRPAVEAAFEGDLHRRLIDELKAKAKLEVDEKAVMGLDLRRP